MIAYIVRQYDKALGMLADCIEKFDGQLWLDAENFSNAAWHIAYHTIVHANIYAAQTSEAVVAWVNEIPVCGNLADSHEPPYKPYKPEVSYSKEQMLDFLQHTKSQIPQYLENFDPYANCWPHWYNQKNIEFQFNSIRHIQHHTGQLIERQCSAERIEIYWR